MNRQYGDGYDGVGAMAVFFFVIVMLYALIEALYTFFFDYMTIL